MGDVDKGGVQIGLEGELTAETVCGEEREAYAVRWAIAGLLEL